VGWIALLLAPEPKSREGGQISTPLTTLIIRLLQLNKGLYGSPGQQANKSRKAGGALIPASTLLNGPMKGENVDIALLILLAVSTGL
jgi:hypothetical protein